MEPGRKRAVAAESLEPAPCLDENILQEFSCICAVSRLESQAESVDPPCVLPIEELEGINVPRLRAPD